MLALTLWPEWAWAVHYLDKRVENRTWKLPDRVIGQPVYLHAGVLPRSGMLGRIDALGDMAHRAGWDEDIQENPWGIILAKGQEVHICHQHGSVGLTPAQRRYHSPIFGGTLLGIMRFTSCDAPSQGDLTGWRVPDQYGWRLEYEPLMEPTLGAKGVLGFWRYAG